MKIMNTLIGVILLANCVTFASCSDDEKVVYDRDVNLTVSNSAILLAQTGGTATIDVESGYFWKIYGEPEWCNLSRTEGEPSQPATITISVGENNSDMPRYVSLKVKSGYESKDLIILQTGKNYIQPDRTGMEHTAKEVVYSIRHGWNLGNTMEAIDNNKLGTGESMETAWGNPVVTKELMDNVYKYGFNGIRIPCGWQFHVVNETDPDSPDYMRIHPDYIKRVKEVVDYCLSDKPDMKVLLNIHNCAFVDYEEAFTEEAIAVSEPKMFKVWLQIAEAFMDYDERLIFAASNEPASMDAESAEILKIYQQAFVNAVRGTGGKNAYRKLFVQAPCTNTGYALSFMQLVSDFVPDCLGVEVHYYEPMLFCLGEDASWGRASYFWGKDYAQKPVKGIDRNCPDNEDAVEAVLPRLKAKFVDNGLPIVSGEYGAMHKDLPFSSTIQKIHDESYAYYHEYIVRRMKENGIVPFVWDTGGTINRNTFEIGNPIQFNAITKGAEANYPE